MGTIIAVNGKGGTGKTTVSGLLIRHLISKNMGSILAVDADPNSNLPDILGVKNPESIVGEVEDVSKHMDKIPAGMTKDRYIEMRIQEALAEEKGFDMLVMGRPEGPGCYCYVNNLLRDITARITKNYDFVVVDNAAGMEHISRRTVRNIDKLVLVSDDSVFGIRSAKRIFDLASEMEIKFKKALMIINKLKEPIAAIKDEIVATKLELAGALSYNDKIHDFSVTARTIFEFEDKKALAEIGSIFNNIMRS